MGLFRAICDDYVNVVNSQLPWKLMPQTPAAPSGHSSGHERAAVPIAASRSWAARCGGIAPSRVAIVPIETAGTARKEGRSNERQDRQAW